MRHRCGQTSLVHALLMGAAVAPFLAVPAMAQEQPQAPSEALEEVVVTGSRIARRDFVSASPLVTVAPDRLKASGSVNVDVALAQMPQFAATAGGATGGGAGINGQGSVSTVNLRGLGANRNLVLLDGRRLPPANASGVVDISIIAPSVIGDVEVISGGASAVYGSDAISGVVNFKTRRFFEGAEASIQYGLTERGYGQTWDASFAVGRKLFDGRGDILLAGGYSRRDHVPSYKRLSLLSNYTLTGFLPSGQANLAAANAPTRAAVDSIFGRYGVPAGQVPVTTAFGFNDDGTLFAVTGGANLRQAGLDPPLYALQGPLVLASLTRENSLVQPQERYNAFGKARFEVTDGVELYAQGIFTRSEERTYGISTIGIPTNPIPVTNPFIPADLRALLASRPNPNAPFILARSQVELGRRNFDTVSDAFQVVVGLTGQLDVGETKWDVYYARAQTKNESTLKNAISNAALLRLYNAPDGGASICQGGYNPFGLAQGMRLSSACLALLKSDSVTTIETRQNIVEGTIGGRLFNLPADAVRYSVTATYRDDGLELDADPRNRPPGTPDPTGQGLPAADIVGLVQSASFPFAKISVKEIAGELLVPIFRNQPFARSLNLNLGARYSDFSTVGGVTTYRAEVDYRLNNSLMFRGGYERAVRAGNFQEALSPPTGIQAVLGPPPVGGDPCDIRTNARAAGGSQLRALCIATGVPVSAIDTAPLQNILIGSQSGNPSVDPEQADTFTIGAVLTPRFGPEWLGGLSASIDYYDIKIDKVISVVTTNNQVNNCYNVDRVSNPTYDPKNRYCLGVIRGADGNLVDVRVQSENLGGLRTKGIDFQANWAFEVGDDRRLTLSAYANYLLEFAVKPSPTAAFVDYAGYFSDPFLADPHPTWKTNVSARYGTSVWDATLTWRHLSAMKDLTRISTPTRALPNTKSYDLFDLLANYRLGDKYVFTAGVNNLFDANPRLSGGQQGVVLTRLYDVLGRRYFVGVKASF